MNIDDKILQVIDLQDENLERTDKKRKLEGLLKVAKAQSVSDPQEQQLKLEKLQNEIDAQEILMAKNMGAINSLQHDIDAYLKANHMDHYTLRQNESTYRVNYQNDALSVTNRS